MDGVLTDWEKSFLKVSGGIAADAYAASHGEEATFEITNDVSYYENMEWMSDGKLLYDFIKGLNGEILSHGPTDKSRGGKLKWLTNHHVKLKPNIVSSREEKIKFAHPNAILIDDREDTVSEFIAQGGRGILHINSTDTIEQLKKMVNVSQSHRIYNSVLDPQIWDENMVLKPEIVSKLLKIANTFYKDTELNAAVQDVLFLGSMAGFNWTETSDIDLHILIDFNQVDENEELVKKYVDKLKNEWNAKYDVVIGKNPVEVYIQNVVEENRSQAVYSLVKNEWVKRPEYTEPKIDREHIKDKYREYVKLIDTATQSPVEASVKALLKKVYNMRESGLSSNGEYSTENLVFKLLRKTGYIDKIRDVIVNITTDDLSG